MIKKRKLPKQPYYKVYDTEYPSVIVYVHESQMNDVVHALGGITPKASLNPLNNIYKDFRT